MAGLNQQDQIDYWWFYQRTLKPSILWWLRSWLYLASFHLKPWPPHIGKLLGGYTEFVYTDVGTSRLGSRLGIYTAQNIYFLIAWYRFSVKPNNLKTISADGLEVLLEASSLDIQEYVKEVERLPTRETTMGLIAGQETGVR